MRRLIFAGLLYLTGIAIFILLKPSLMFKENGQWKEFGIGRDPEYFTWMPFWLFTILWSVLSYIIVMLIEDSLAMSQTYQEPPPQVPIQGSVNTKRNSRVKNTSQDLTPGYYMLNEGRTGRNGIPRYVYLGPEAPEVPESP
jgi:hypothetical protein